MLMEMEMLMTVTLMDKTVELMTLLCKIKEDNNNV